MGIPVHLLVINELELCPEHYAWLAFAEGKQYKAYREQLSEDITQDEKHQIYLDILAELEEEGKERMAYEVVSRIIENMPPERSDEIVNRMLSIMSPERREKLLHDLSAETLFATLSRLPAEQLQEALTALPAERLQMIREIFDRIGPNSPT